MKNTFTKLSEAKGVHQGKIQRELERDLEFWDSTEELKWWVKGETEAQREMIEFEKGFRAFRESLLGDEDIDEAFLKWAGTPIEQRNGTISCAKYKYKILIQHCRYEEGYWNKQDEQNGQ